MAKVSMAPLLSNSIGDYSVYKQRGVEKVILRAKGGPNARMLKTELKFQSVRNQQSEIRGMGKLSSYLTAACTGVKHLADHNFAGNFSKIARLMQKMDAISEAGKAAVMFSTYGTMINGFNFNNCIVFNSVVPQPQYSISRSELKATVSFPDLYPGINFHSKWPDSVFRFIITLGLIPDMIYTDKDYITACPGFKPARATNQGEWTNQFSKMNAFSMEISLKKEARLNESVSLLLSVGIEFGRHITESVIEPVKYAGCASILGVG